LLGFSFLALFGAGAFFWNDKKMAGFAFLVAFVIALAGVSHQRIVLSSFVLGVVVERAPHPEQGE
jgi:hypothetical protein